jgi:hypothetical protein
MPLSRGHRVQPVSFTPNLAIGGTSIGLVNRGNDKRSRKQRVAVSTLNLRYEQVL